MLSSASGLWLNPGQFLRSSVKWAEFRSVSGVKYKGAESWSVSAVNCKAG